jgi:hypothetical protein
MVAAMLANLEPESRSRHRWRSDPTAAIMTVVSFVERLMDERDCSPGPQWQCPACEASRAAMTAVEGFV